MHELSETWLGGVWEACRLAKRDLQGVCGEAGETAACAGLHLLFRRVLRSTAMWGGCKAESWACRVSWMLLLVLVCTCLTKPGGLVLLDSVGLST